MDLPKLKPPVLSNKDVPKKSSFSLTRTLIKHQQGKIWA